MRFDLRQMMHWVFQEDTFVALAASSKLIVARLWKVMLVTAVVAAILDEAIQKRDG